MRVGKPFLGGRYGGEHKAPKLQAEAVYGLTELNREAIRGARLVANPGCYPTSVQLPLVPLLAGGLIQQVGYAARLQSWQLVVIQQLATERFAACTSESCCCLHDMSWTCHTAGVSSDPLADGEKGESARFSPFPWSD